jgi:DNA-binding transcriptional LysR family regulator
VPVVEVRSAISACTLAQQGLGVALVDPLCIDASLLEHIDVSALKLEKHLKVQAVYSRAEPLSNSARQFIKLLREVLDEHRAAPSGGSRRRGRQPDGALPD